jgi:hypothetical protein
MANQMVRIQKEDPSKKVYLICLRTAEGDMWDLIEGRNEARDYIKDKIMYCDVDIESSFILVDTLTLRKRSPIYDFMKYVEQYIKESDPFDIEDYVNGDVIESTEEVDNDIEENTNTEGQLSMMDLMDGNFRTQNL